MKAGTEHSPLGTCSTEMQHPQVKPGVLRLRSRNRLLLCCEIGNQHVVVFLARDHLNSMVSQQKGKQFGQLEPPELGTAAEVSC